MGDINKALADGAKPLQNSDCQKGLAQAGINVTDLIKAFGDLKARPDSDPSTKGYNIFYAEKSTDPQVQQFLQTESGKGAGGFIYGQDVMLRKAFFNARGGANRFPDLPLHPGTDFLSNSVGVNRFFRPNNGIYTGCLEATYAVLAKGLIDVLKRGEFDRLGYNIGRPNGLPLTPQGVDESGMLPAIRAGFKVIEIFIMTQPGKART